MNAADDFLLGQQPASIAAREAEFGVVGALLNSNGLFDLVDRLRPEHFADEKLRAVFAELNSQLAKGLACDVVTIFEAGAGKFDLVYLTELSQQFTPSAGTLLRYVELIVDAYQARRLSDASGQIYDLAHDTSRPISDRIVEAQEHLARLEVDAGEDDEWSEIHEGLVAHSALLEQRQDGKVQGWGTGLSDLDRLLNGGLRPGALVIVAGRPSMGKTALALSMAMHLSIEHPTSMFSLEMPLTELRDRQTAILGRMALDEVIQPKRDTSFDKVLEAVEAARLRKFCATDKPGLTIQQIRSRARKHKRSRGLDILVVDYIGLMGSTNSKETRNQQLGEISRGLKAMAKELDCVVLCLAQLNRAVEQRGAGSRPLMSDLRDSGEIEQDADVILFVHREERANPKAGPQWKGHAELIVAKNRQGRCGTVHAAYIGDQTRFDGWYGEPPSNGAAAPIKKRGGFE
ncbi:replicative DNA helicase [Comamonas serinivorans]|nr:DnaB-like helicase C-terminal domain-containing protein [Comamonas serinivorans]